MEQSVNKFLAFAFLLITQPCFAQLPALHAGKGAPGGGGFTPSCSQSSAFLARATGITLTVDKTRYDTLICGMVTDGTFAKMDAVYIFAAPDATTARLNLVSSSFGLTEHGTVTFSAYHGFTGNGSTGYEDTGFNPSTAGGNYVQNAASLAAYVLTSRTAQNSYASIGSVGSVASLINPKQAGGSGGASYAANQGTINLTSVNANAQGFWVVSRTASTTAELYMNGAAFNADTNASGAVSAQNMFVLADNSGGAQNFSADQLSAAAIGGGLSSTDVTNLSSRINTFMTAYGINVY